MRPAAKPLVWLHGEVKTPPLSTPARVEAGLLLRRLQQGEQLGLPQSRPMPAPGPRCHELRIADGDSAWRIAYRIDDDAIVVAGVFRKMTQTTPHTVIDRRRQRLRAYDGAAGKGR